MNFRRNHKLPTVHKLESNGWLCLNLSIPQVQYFGVSFVYDHDHDHDHRQFHALAHCQCQVMLKDGGNLQAIQNHRHRRHLTGGVSSTENDPEQTLHNSHYGHGHGHGYVHRRSLLHHTRVEDLDHFDDV